MNKVEGKQKVVLELEVEENDYNGVTWRYRIISKSHKEFSDDFKEKIYDDIGFEI